MENLGIGKGKEGLIEQAQRQIKASEGHKIQWYFENEEVMKATKTLFHKEGIQKIELIFKELPKAL